MVTSCFLGFEVIYIVLQAARGQESHFNVSTPFYAFMFNLMAIGAVTATLVVGYIGLQFFTLPQLALPTAYLWGIRIGVILFVIFAFEGFAMGARLSHSVGTSEIVKTIPFLNWSLTVGDLRIAHFVGMHALQILPLLGYYVFKNKYVILSLGIAYFGMATFLLVHALRSK